MQRVQRLRKCLPLILITSLMIAVDDANVGVGWWFRVVRIQQKMSLSSGVFGVSGSG